MSGLALSFCDVPQHRSNPADVHDYAHNISIMYLDPLSRVTIAVAAIANIAKAMNDAEANTILYDYLYTKVPISPTRNVLFLMI